MTARVDWSNFSCRTCAAAPHLQKLQGCFTPAPRAFLKVVDLEFTRCPVRYQHPRAHVMAIQVREGYLTDSKYHERMANPAKRLAALRYLELLSVKNVERA